MKEQKVITYCAWCMHIPTKTRDKDTFYSSRICDKHLRKLQIQDYANKGNYKTRRSNALL